MIDFITGHDLRRLAETMAEHCVSIFLPTHRSGPDKAQDPIRLNNLLNSAAAELDVLGVRRPVVDRLLAPARDLHGDGDFWAHQDKGLAVHLAPGGMETHRLPQTVAEQVVVADRFHIKPLIGSLTTGKTFHVLALSQHAVRLLRGDPAHLTEIELGDIPHSLAEALWWDDRERQTRSHSSGRFGQGRVTATFHGQGGFKDSRNEDVARFLRAVDKGVTHLIGDASTPLVLAGVDHLVALYRNSSRQPGIVEGSIPGNVDGVDPDQLHARAWDLARPILERDRQAAATRFLDGTSPNCADVPDTVIAAGAGRVQTLFVPVGVQRWGTFDPNGPVVDEHDTRQPGDRDLLDVAAVETLVNSGTVFTSTPEEIPGGGLLAAVLRY